MLFLLPAINYNLPVVFASKLSEMGKSLLNMNNGNVSLDDIVKYCPNFKPEQMTPSFEEVIDLDVFITPYQFIGIDSSVEKMTFSLLIAIKWQALCREDEHPDFIPKNSSTILYPNPSTFWKPLIFVLHSPNMLIVGDEREEYLKVTVSNKMDQKTIFDWEWSIVGTFEIHCDLNLLLFPADVQNCSFQIQTKEFLFVQKFKSCLISYQPEQMKFTTENSNWQLVNMDCNIRPGYAMHSMLSMSFKMARIPRFYMVHLVGPCILLIFLELCSFALPIDSPERTAYTMTIYLAFIFLESMLFTILPQTPKLVLLSDHIVFQTVFSTIMTVYSAIACKVAKRFSKSIVTIGQKKFVFLI